MEYLDERYPEPALLPDGRRGARARRGSLVHRFDDLLGATTTPSAAARRTRSTSGSSALEVGQSLFADIAFVPWVIRARDMLGVALPAHRGAAGSPSSSSVRRSPPRSRRRAGAVSEIDDRGAARPARRGRGARRAHGRRSTTASLGKPCDPRQGHIPGARNVDVYRLMNLDLAEIEAELGVEPGGEVVAYCHSGSRSAIATQMLRALGYDARNYVGSWHEWSRHDDLPVES